MKYAFDYIWHTSTAILKLQSALLLISDQRSSGIFAILATRGPTTALLQQIYKKKSCDSAENDALAYDVYVIL